MRTRARRLAAAAVAAAALVAAAGACQGGGNQAGGTAGKQIKGGTVNVALPPAVTTNWIFPLAPLANFSVYNISYLEQPMYRPLYWFGGHNYKPTVDYGLSVAQPPKYAADGKSVKIDLKSYKWSNGETVDADGVLFWINMLKAEKANYGGYTPGLFPDNLTKVTKDSDTSVTLKFNRKYSSQWFTYNQLSLINPMPQAWDVTSLNGKPGSGGCTKSVKKCAKVFKFLEAQSKDQKSYATSKIWSVVDGPWKLGDYSSSGKYSLVPNKSYSGSPKPKLDKVVFLPFTTDSAEFNVLKTGKTLDLGYIPSQDRPNKPAGQDLPKNNPAGPNYNMEAFYTWSVNYFPINFNNPKYGPIFKQLYFRQALALTLNQPLAVQKADKGYGYPNIGPVPIKPDNQFLSTNGKGKGPYSFSTSKAKSLLTSHGWSMQGGVMTCTKPGPGANQCGQGVKSGSKLEIPFHYANGTTALTLAMQQYKSDASKAGIVLQMKAQPFNTVIGEAVACKPNEKTCDWTIDNWGGGWVYAPGYLPTGEALWATGAGSNPGSYSDPKMDKLIQATEYSNDPAALAKYQDYAIQQLPVIYQSNTYGVSVTSKHVGGVIRNPLYTIVPEYWYRTK